MRAFRNAIRCAILAAPGDVHRRCSSASSGFAAVAATPFAMANALTTNTVMIAGPSLRFAAMRSAIRLLTPREKLSAVAIVAIMMLGGILESGVVGLTVPLVYAVV